MAKSSSFADSDPAVVVQEGQSEARTAYNVAMRLKNSEKMFRCNFGEC